VLLTILSISGDDEMQADWLSTLVSWLPFLVLIGLWFWFARSSGMRASVAVQESASLLPRVRHAAS
jgi:ATP-dependent Zn protease